MGLLSTVYSSMINKIMYAGYTIISWILVLFPFIIFLFILIIGLFGFTALSNEEKRL